MELQKNIQVPILSSCKVVFCPSNDELVQASTVFKGNGKHTAKFVRSYYNADLPDGKLPEVILVSDMTAVL